MVICVAVGGWASVFFPTPQVVSARNLDGQRWTFCLQPGRLIHQFVMRGSSLYQCASRLGFGTMQLEQMMCTCIYP